MSLLRLLARIGDALLYTPPDPARAAWPIDTSPPLETAPVSRRRGASPRRV